MNAIKEITRKIAENSVEIERQTKNNSFDLKKFHGADADAGELSAFMLSAKAFDILAGIHIGALPYLREKHGADGLIIKNGKIEDVEFKTSARTINADNSFITARGTIYLTKEDNKLLECVKKSEVVIMESAFYAAFAVQYESNLHSKCRDTYLLAFDEHTNQIIDCYMLDGDTVVDYLRTSNSIKLGTFIKHGRSVELKSGPVIGYDAWKKKLGTTLPLKSTWK
jgi:hypothetical protein